MSSLQSLSYSPALIRCKAGDLMAAHSVSYGAWRARDLQALVAIGLFGVIAIGFPVYAADAL